MRLDTVGRNARAAFGLVSLLAAACGEGAGRGGTIVIATAQDPDGLLPATYETREARVVGELLFDRLAERGPALNTVGDVGFEPRLARRWEWSRDSLSVRFHLDPRARWHDGRPVRAGDVRFAFLLYTDPAVASRLGGDLREAMDSISVSDSLTCTAWFRTRTPEQFNTLVTTLAPLPEHLLGGVRRDSVRTSAFALAPVGSGPFRFVKWEPRQRLEIAAVESFYRGRPVLDRVIWSYAPEMSTLVQKLFAGEADFFDMVPPPSVPEAASHPDVRLLPRGNFDYSFLQLNLFDGPSERPHPLFADRALRRALAMGLDRRALVRSLFDTLGHVLAGPFVRAQWSADTSLAQLPFDRPAAARTLDSLGWRVGPDGVRTRGGRPLAFRLLYPASSTNRKNMSVLIQEQLRGLGVRVELDGADNNAFVARGRARQYDAYFGGLIATPSPSGIRQTWTSDAAKPGGFNTGRYLNTAFDAQVDSALNARDVASAKAYYRAAYRIINEDAPAIWLYEPPQVAGAHRRLRTGPLRADAWWLDIPAWSIVPGTRLSRDSAAAP